MSKKKHPPVAVIVVVVLILIVAGYFSIRALIGTDSQELSASGTIETISITISPEIGGRITNLYVGEGETVRAGDVLFSLDDNTIQAQRNVSQSTVELALAAVKSAQVNYELVLDSAMVESAISRGTEWRSASPLDFTLPAWYFDQGDELQAAQAALDAATASYNTAREVLDGLLVDPENSNMITAELRLINARATVLVAQDVLTRANMASVNASISDTAQTAYDAALLELQDAQATYDAISGSAAGARIVSARSELAVSQARVDAARDRLLTLQFGVYAPKVTSARAALEQTQKGVAQAEASLALIDAQMKKLTVVTPTDGVILSMNIQAGEVVGAGATALTLGRLDELFITVFIPEDRYGVLLIGQQAEVRVDSFPGEDFGASIIHISDRAEFTPRNVQTMEGRSSTVFAIKLRIFDPGGRLKPGMPADVSFRQGE